MNGAVWRRGALVMSERGVRGVWCVVWARGGGSRTGADFVPKE